MHTTNIFAKISIKKGIQQKVIYKMIDIFLLQKSNTYF